MKYRSPLLKLVCTLACTLVCVLAVPALAADLQKGLRLKASNQHEAAATEFAALVKENPSNVQAIEQLAIVSGWLARYDVSIANWERLLVLQPQREDARIAIARVRYWKGEHGAALKGLDDVLSRQPKSADALALRGDVLLASNKFDAARASYLEAEKNGADKAEMARKIAQIVPPKPWRLDTGFTQDKYDNVRGNEGSAFVQLGYQFTRGLGIYGRYENARKYGSADNTTFFGASWRAFPALQLYGEVGSTQSPAFRPSLQAEVGGELLYFKRVQPSLSYRESVYEGNASLGSGTIASGKGSVGTLTPGVRVVFPGLGDIEFRYSISQNIDKSVTQVSQLRFNFDAGENLSPYIAFYSGEEALPPQPSASFKAYALGAVYKLGPQWSLRGDLSREERPNFYNRNSAGLGLSYLF